MKIIRKISLLIILLLSLNAHATEAEIKKIKRQKLFYERLSLPILSTSTLLWLAGIVTYFSRQTETHDPFMLPAAFFMGSSMPMLLLLFTRLKKYGLEEKLTALLEQERKQELQIIQQSYLCFLTANEVNRRQREVSSILQKEISRRQQEILARTNKSYKEESLQIKVTRELFLKKIFQSV